MEDHRQQMHAGRSLPRLLDRRSDQNNLMQQRKAKSNKPSNPSSKGSISLLQEFVQGSQKPPIEVNYPVLQWTYENQMANAATLEFRAIVAFLLNGIPHHVVGAWQPKKKDAQRDAADRALVLFMEIRGREKLREDMVPIDTTEDVEKAQWSEAMVQQWCETSEMCGYSAPTYSVDGDEQRGFVATLEIALYGVPHKFRGNAFEQSEAARQDVARRALWYLQVPGYADDFEVDCNTLAAVAMKIPAPPPHWANDPESDVKVEMAERKTAIMRLQNRLQQRFSKDLRPGTSVWEWTYESLPTEMTWPPLYQATVKIAVMDKVFTGSWQRGQRDAQLDVIRLVTEILDEIDRSQS